uniref:Uncharacterized protein n=1 Tax=Iconisemion striatum TaxID=60296 RepID=A0A1A7YS68_9TELE
MEAKYPNLMRPRRKLCYISEKKSQFDQWEKTFTLDDVDKMFDDIAEQHPTTVLHQGSYSDSNQSDTERSPVLQRKCRGRQIATHIPIKEDFIDPVARPTDPQLDSYLNVPIKLHDPVETSSPIEQKTSKNDLEMPDSDHRRVMSPILLNSEDEMVEEPQKAPLPTQKSQCDGQVTEKRGNAADADDDDFLESSQNMVVQFKKSSHKGVAKDKDNTKPSVSAARKQPKPASAKMADAQPPAEKAAPAGKDMNAFLLKMKQAVLSNQTPARKSPVKSPPPAPPPIPEEDFLILEDDPPLYVTIPSRSGKKTRHQLNKTFGSEKEIPLEKGSKASPQEVEKAAGKRGTQADDEKVKKGTDDVCDGLTNPEDPPAGDPMERKMSKKEKRQRKKVSSKERSKEEELPVDGVDVETEKGFQKSKTKAAKYNKQIRSEDEEEILTSRNKTLKDRKRLQTPKAVMEEVEADVEEQSDGETAGNEDLGSCTEKEVLKPEENDSDKSGESSHEEVQALGKRRRKPTGQWWRISGSPEETEPPQPPKKSKQNNSIRAAPSAAAAKNRNVYRKRNQKPPAHTDSATGNRRKKEEQIEEVDEIGTAEAEQEIPDADLDQESSSPLVLTHRDVSLSSGVQIFQKVYNCSSTDKPSVTPTSPVAPKPAKDPLREAEPAKRRRKPPGSWWEVLPADDSEGVTTSSSQPQQLPPQEPKPQKEQKKKSKQRKAAPKIVNRSSEPPGGALVSPLKRLKPSKTVKDSLAAFKDILTSGVQTPAPAASRDADQNNSRVVMPCPAETFSVTPSTAAPDVGHHSHTQPTSQHRKHQSDNTLKAFMSGPSSVIEMENAEETDLPSRAQSLLSAADLCAPPLKPLTLHSKDKVNLADWFQTLWSTTAHEPATITPDQFQWFFHQDRALGIQVDLNSSCFCSGKILMGSYMKKPLWVDHSATTVFHLLTSSLSVTINGSVSHYKSGQAFSVECGQAYSIQNTLSQPAVLLFTRMLAESLD